MRFWDTSALVPLAVDEPLTPEIQAIFRADEAVVLWWGSVVEGASALAQALRAGSIGPEGQDASLRRFLALEEAAYEVQPAAEVRSRALRLLRLHPLRAADALQLAAALTWCRDRPSGLGCVCLDSRLREAARREGFEVLPERF